MVTAEDRDQDHLLDSAIKETSTLDESVEGGGKANYNLNNKNSNNNNNSSNAGDLSDTDASGKSSQKYVLMCFICKLSFGETKSFFQHAKFEHKICDLKWKKEFHANKVDLDNCPSLSAIIQKDSNDSPSVCFLEPMSTNYNYETLLKGTKIEIPGQQQESNDQHPPKLDVPDLSSFFKEEALKHRKLSEALQSVVASSEAAAAAAAAAANDEKNNMLATAAAGGNNNNNLNAYLFELCRQIYGGGAGGLPLPHQNNSSKTEQQQHSHSINNNNHHQHQHHSMGGDKTPNNARSMTPDPSEMCEVKIKEERDSLTPIKFESPEMMMNKSPANIKSDRSENGYPMDTGLLLGMNSDGMEGPDAMTSNLLAMYQTMAVKRQQQQQNLSKEPQMMMDPSSMSTLFCPEHKFSNGNGQVAPDCKNCAIVNLIKSSMKSPPPPSQQNSSSSSAAGGGTKVSPNSSFTIGMCPDHLNGRPLGVECLRCEMILNSSRMSGHSAVTSSTRNSCKTLKCPQCNWHYKYQETLEIHMREKHPDGESACAFCLAGQQHPRLARGESYTCGYKPYRCEICNYSTTTKGNLSIHMQSDKHLNNMQELSNQQQQQQIVDVEPLPLSKTPQKSPPHMSNTTSSVATDLSSLGQSAVMMNKMCNTMKPNFRCDVCSYETSVARNLRIHMTSEKHIQNMTALQQNIKQYQFMKQAPPANIMQQLQNCLPEQAIADYSYNQALLIKLLQHQNQMGGGDSGLSTPQPEGVGDDAGDDLDDMAKSEGTSGGNTSIDAEMASHGGAGGDGNASRSTDSNNNAENKDLSMGGGNRKTPDSQQQQLNWFNDNNDETRGSDCSSNNDQYSSSENRYSDPQRPYKCDVCQESFTQKSILLVHFNSVSHINRIKKQLPGKSGDESSSSNNLKRKLSDSDQDSPKKRFKCDICKVAYAQGSTLDIHMRSVLHQTRTCRMNQEQQLRAMQQNSSDNKDRPSSTGPPDSSAQIYKSLLENFGFDIVKQFNDIDKLGPQAALSQMYKAGLLSEESINKPLSLVPEKNLLAVALDANEAMDCSTTEKQQQQQFFCRYCNKSFSSMYVLKAHYEDVHNDSLPMGVLESLSFPESPKKSFFKGNSNFQEDQHQVIDFSNKPKDERAELISPKRNMTPDTSMIPPVVGPSFEEQQMLQKHLQTMNMLSLMNQNSRGNGEEMQPPPANSFDLLNLLQFHQHLLSLNFMNLAPPLMINNNVQQQQQQQQASRAGHRADSVMEDSLMPPSPYGNAVR